ncbi:MAG: hypothetical protein RMY64_24970 [Nostoc sp. DedQUE08]|nr:hypothetical protein [Nostoc sp. DedQUE08]
MMVIVGIGHWALGIGYWALGIGHWAQKPEVQRGRGKKLTATFSSAPLLPCFSTPLAALLFAPKN